MLGFYSIKQTNKQGEVSMVCWPWKPNQPINLWTMPTLAGLGVLSGRSSCLTQDCLGKNSSATSGSVSGGLLSEFYSTKQTNKQASMPETRRTVLSAQQYGEYGSNDEWKRHLHGRYKPFMLRDRDSNRLEVLCVPAYPPLKLVACWGAQYSWSSWLY